MKSKTIFTSCDIYRTLLAEVEEGELLRVHPKDFRTLRANICVKGLPAPSGFARPYRVLQPFPGVDQRGARQRQRGSWDEVLDEVAQRSQVLIDIRSVEALSLSISPWNIGTKDSDGRHLVNLSGSANWIGVERYGGNTALINRTVFGWFPYPNFYHRSYIGPLLYHQKQQSWASVCNNFHRAQIPITKLIVLDMRRSESVNRAAQWFPLSIETKAGHD